MAELGFEHRHVDHEAVAFIAALRGFVCLPMRQSLGKMVSQTSPSAFVIRCDAYRLTSGDSRSTISLKVLKVH